MRRSAVVALLLLWVMPVAACNPFQGSTPAASSTAVPLATLHPMATSSPQPSAAPDNVVRIPELRLLRAATGPGWLAIGLVRNQGWQGIESVEIGLLAKDWQGNILANGIATSSLSRVPPGGESPFAFELDVSEEPATLEVTTQSWREVNFPPPSFTVRILRTWTGGEGTHILGLIANTGQLPMALADLTLVSRDVQGDLSAFGRLGAGPAVLPPGEEIPFLAHLIAGSDAERPLAFPDLRPLDPSRIEPSLAITKGPELRQDPQGNLHLIGEMANPSDMGAWLSALVGFRLDGEWLLAVRISHPLPLSPGETRAFLCDDLPGLRALLAEREADLERLQIEIWIDPPSSNHPVAETAPLQVEIGSYEKIGSSIFMRGSLSNPGEREVFRPTVHGTILTTSGELVSAGWTTPLASIGPGGATEFVLRLPLGVGVDPTFFEPLVWAAGLKEPLPQAEG
jgi:hypothetical protein